MSTITYAADFTSITHPAYSPEQQAAIDSAVAEAVPDHFMDYSWSDRIVQRGSQFFAVFQQIAREFLPAFSVDDTDTHLDYLPVLVDGRALHQWPEEGRSGMLYLVRITQRPGHRQLPPNWFTCFIHTGWLDERELTLTDGEIADIIVDEVDSGASPITGIHSNPRFA